VLVGRQGYWTSRITTVPLSEPVMMRVSSKHSRVQRVITGVCRMARSFCADGRTQGRRSAGAGGMGRYLLLTTYYLLLTTYYLLLTSYQRAQVPYLDERVKAAGDHLRLGLGLGLGLG